MSFSMQGHIFLMGIYVEMELLESSSCQFWRECQVVFWNTGIPFIVSRSVWEILFPYAFTKSYFWVFKSLQFWWVCQLVSSVAQLCPTLCDPMDCSRPGPCVHHQSLAFTQTHIYWVGDAIQPSHPLSSHSLPPSVFPSIRIFSNKSVLHIRWPKLGVSASPSGLPMNIQDWLPLGWIGWISL